MSALRKRGFFLGILLLGAAVGLEAATVKVDPTMTRAQIQAVIDAAKDKSTIRFKAGTYDFSSTPFVSTPFDGAALVVNDKDLKFVAEKGVILLGKASALNSSGFGDSGIICFLVTNSPEKSVSFKGFAFNKFLFGIISGICLSWDPVNHMASTAPSCRDFTVQNCVFQNIDHLAVAATGVVRNIKVIHNTVVWSRRYGIQFDWFWLAGHLQTQPAAGKITMTNNEIHARTYGVYITRGLNMSIKNNVFDNSGTDEYYNDGLNIEGGATGASIVNNRFSHVFCAIDLGGFDYDNGSTVTRFPLTKAKVTNNKISAAVGGIWTGGQAVYGNTFQNNTIAVGTALGWGIATWGGHNETFTANKISGTGEAAISIRSLEDFWEPGLAGAGHDNIAKKNSVKAFAGIYGFHYYYDSHTYDNEAVGICAENGMVHDEGTNNRFTCLGKTAGPTGLAAGVPGFGPGRFPGWKRTIR